MTCPLSHICIRCAHGSHAACRGVVTCPDDGQERVCECCGEGAS